MKFIFIEALDKKFCFYNNEIEKIIELKKNNIIKNKLKLKNGSVILNFIKYKNMFYPLLDIYSLFGMDKRDDLYYSIMIKKVNSDEILFGLCVPEIMDEVEIDRNNIVIFPDFLINKQFIKLIFGLIYFKNVPYFLLSFSEFSNILNIFSLSLELKKGVKYGIDR